jgi:hypothetical protein
MSQICDKIGKYIGIIYFPMKEKGFCLERGVNGTSFL